MVVKKKPIGWVKSDEGLIEIYEPIIISGSGLTITPRNIKYFVPKSSKLIKD